MTKRSQPQETYLLCLKGELRLAKKQEEFMRQRGIESLTEGDGLRLVLVTIGELEKMISELESI
jgi:hypothetical protein